MSKNYDKLLKALIDDLNSKSDEDIFQELLEAGIILDDISDSTILMNNITNVNLRGISSNIYSLKETDLLCA